jgi:hypothetical protein
VSLDTRKRRNHSLVVMTLCLTFNSWIVPEGRKKPNTAALGQNSKRQPGLTRVFGFL